MLFQVIKDGLARQAEYSKHRHFLDMGFLAIEEKARKLTARYSKLQSFFLLIMTFGFGPVLGTLLATGQLELGDDAPIWVNILCVILPILMFGWMVQVLRTHFFSPPEIVFDAMSRQIRLINPSQREHYPGKKWPERVAADDIAGFEIRKIAADNGSVWSLLLNLDNDNFLILLTAQKEETITKIRTFMRDKMELPESEEGTALAHLDEAAAARKRREG